MRRHLICLRTTAKWVATASLLLAIGAWVGSFFYWAFGALPSHWLVFEVRAGQFVVTHVHQPPFYQLDASLRVWRAPPADYSDAPGFDLVWSEPVLRCKVWMPVAVLAIPAALCWRFDGRAAMRRRNGCCTQCGYDRRGLAADAKCPECGTVAAPAPK